MTLATTTFEGLLTTYRMFNAGSPINVAAGDGSADMEELVRYYKEKYDIMEENRLADIRNGKVGPVDARPDTPETKMKLYRATK